MQLGPYRLSNHVLLAPMAGVTDRPFRDLCRRLGAGMAVSEMVSSDVRMRQTRKSLERVDHRDEPSPRSVQIVGTDPVLMAQAARFNVDRGAELIDVNMGCPAKKVCNVLAGSALLRDEPRVAAILEAVVSAVDVPVTLKMRTGWDPQHRNGVRIARIAEAAGVSAIAVHGRTRACAFRGEAEFETVKEIRAAVRIPLIANGDMRSGEHAARVLAHTGADAVMVGRGAQGNPWIFREIRHFLRTGERATAPTHAEVRETLIEHLDELHHFYGEGRGVRIARKHLSWYCGGRPGRDEFWRRVNRVESAREQVQMTIRYFDEHGEALRMAA